MSTPIIDSGLETEYVDDLPSIDDSQKSSAEDDEILETVNLNAGAQAYLFHVDEEELIVKFSHPSPSAKGTVTLELYDAKQNLYRNVDIIFPGEQWRLRMFEQSSDLPYPPGERRRLYEQESQGNVLQTPKRKELDYTSILRFFASLDVDVKTFFILLASLIFVLGLLIGSNFT